MRTHNTGFVSSIPPCVTFKTPLVRKATGNNPMNSNSLEKTQSHVSGFCYPRNRVYNAVFFVYTAVLICQFYKPHVELQMALMSDAVCASSCGFFVIPSHCLNSMSNNVERHTLILCIRSFIHSFIHLFVLSLIHFMLLFHLSNRFSLIQFSFAIYQISNLWNALPSSSLLIHFKSMINKRNLIALPLSLPFPSLVGPSLYRPTWLFLNISHYYNVKESCLLCFVIDKIIFNMVIQKLFMRIETQYLLLLLLRLSLSKPWVHPVTHIFSPFLSTHCFPF